MVVWKRSTVASHIRNVGLRPRCNMWFLKALLQLEFAAAVLDGLVSDVHVAARLAPIRTFDSALLLAGRTGTSSAQQFVSPPSSIIRPG